MTLFQQHQTSSAIPPSGIPQGIAHGFDEMYPKKRVFIISFGFLAIVIAGLLSLGIWSWFGQLEESVPGSGQMIPEGKVRRVMSPLNGEVVKVYTRENQVVRKGDVLVELDPEPANVESKGLQEQLTLLEAEANALQAAISLQRAAGARPGSGSIHDAWLVAMQQAYQAQQADAQMQIVKAQHSHNEAVARARQVEEVLATSEKLLENYRQLYNEGGLPERSLREYEQQVASQRGELSALNQLVEATRADMEKARIRPRELQNTYQRDILSRLTEIERRIALTKSELERTHVTQKRQYIRAPLDGVINEQAIRGPGDVVMAGQTLLSIVPQEMKMVAEVRVANRDLSYIHPKQRAALRLDAFPYQQFGRLFGTVESISPSTSTENREDEPNVPYYVVIIRPEKDAMELNGVVHPFRSGMTLTADIITREKNILSFFTEPLRFRLDKAFRDPANR